MAKKKPGADEGADNQDQESADGKPRDETEGGQDQAGGGADDGAPGDDAGQGQGGEGNADADENDLSSGAADSGAGDQVNDDPQPEAEAEWEPYVPPKPQTLTDMVVTALANPAITHDDRLRLDHLLLRFSELKVHLRQLELTTAPDLRDLLGRVESQL